MSNAQVGIIYQHIISDAIEASRVDFEEGGVDEHVLEELRQGWQQKLSQLNIATFPWDPKPEPVAAPALPSSMANYQSMNTPPIAQGGQTLPSMNPNNGPRIKPEPGHEPQPVPLASQPFTNPMLNMANATTAQQRAAAHLANNYGQRAAASISAIQGSIPQQQGQSNHQGNMPHMQQQQQQNAGMHQHPIHPQMQQRPQNFQQQQQMGRGQAQPQQQGQGGPRPTMSPEEYKAELARQIARQAPQATQAQNGVKAAQTDGAGDEFEETFGVVKRVDASGREVEMGRLEIDGLIRSRIVAMGQSMEGGGLMVPLHQLPQSSKRSRKSHTNSGVAAAQTDGPGGSDDSDDEKAGKAQELDEDAINSDLDDPDEGLNEDEDDEESLGHIMLCVYDKVQRVKNKWKCILKDGVLTVNGREYVFHKATGEYEW